LAKAIERAGEEVGEPTWRMPLFKKYFKTLKSPVADMMNSSADSFAGAITAALFLEKFIEGKKWAHFDVMAYSRGSDGAFSEGGNGQSFQILAQYLLRRET
jgi:leucyl aminopeptidase